MDQLLRNRMKLLGEELTTVQNQINNTKQYLLHLESIMNDLAGYTDHHLLERFHIWLVDVYNSTDLTEVDQRRLEAIGAHIQGILRDGEIK